MIQAKKKKQIQRPRRERGKIKKKQIMIIPLQLISEILKTWSLQQKKIPKKKKKQIPFSMHNSKQLV
jgi:hypothetical protein